MEARESDDALDPAERHGPERAVAQAIEDGGARIGPRRRDVRGIEWMQAEMDVHFMSRHQGRHDNRGQGREREGQDEGAEFPRAPGEAERDRHQHELEWETRIGPAEDQGEPRTMVDEGQVGPPVQPQGAIPARQRFVPERAAHASRGVGQASRHGREGDELRESREGRGEARVGPPRPIEERQSLASEADCSRQEEAHPVHAEACRPHQDGRDRRDHGDGGPGAERVSHPPRRHRFVPRFSMGQDEPE